MAVLGIDVGGTKVASAAFGGSGELFAKEVMLLDGVMHKKIFQLFFVIVMFAMSDTASAESVVVGAERVKGSLALLRVKRCTIDL